MFRRQSWDKGKTEAWSEAGFQTDFWFHWKTHPMADFEILGHYVEIGLAHDQKNWNFGKIFEWVFQDLPKLVNFIPQ